MFSLLAWIIFGIGFLSSRVPAVIYFGKEDLIIFVGIPILLIAIPVFIIKNWLIRILGIIQIVAIISIAVWFLVEIQNHPLFKWLDRF